MTKKDTKDFRVQLPKSKEAQRKLVEESSQKHRVYVFPTFTMRQAMAT